jgi:ribosomal protein L37AE/L43A
MRRPWRTGVHNETDSARASWHHGSHMETQALPLPICPLCHTVDKTISPETLAAGGAWACTLCSQNWSQSRLDVVTAYKQYDLARKAAAAAL